MKDTVISRTRTNAGCQKFEGSKNVNESRVSMSGHRDATSARMSQKVLLQPQEDGTYIQLGTPLQTSNLIQLGTPLQPAEPEEDLDWCKIYYYHRAEQVGKGFPGVQRRVNICDQSVHNQYLLHDDIMNVDQCFEENDMITLLYADGIAYVSNMTTKPIFLQSWVGNVMFNYHKSTVIEVAPGLQGIGIFDIKIYLEQLNRTFERMMSAIQGRNYEDQTQSRGDLEKMQHRCIARISLQGFGENFREKVIKDCPFWFEVHFTSPLKWNEKVKEYIDHKCSLRPNEGNHINNNPTGSIYPSF